jgi:uncharacterized protein YbjT (DUF2867 family)
VRDPVKLTDVPWASEVEIVTGDLDDASTLPAAMEGVDVLYYLVHSMGKPGHFRDQEERAAENVARAAKDSGVVSSGKTTINPIVDLAFGAISEETLLSKIDNIQ